MFNILTYSGMKQLVSPKRPNMFNRASESSVGKYQKGILKNVYNRVPNRKSLFPIIVGQGEPCPWVPSIDKSSHTYKIRENVRLSTCCAKKWLLVANECWYETTQHTVSCKLRLEPKQLILFESIFKSLCTEPICLQWTKGIDDQE